MTITFIHDGKPLTADLKEIHGSAYITYHLFVDNYYRGRLWKAGEIWYWESRLYPGIKEQVVAVVERR